MNKFPAIYKVWKWIEQKTVPHFKYGYTVNDYIKDILYKDYGVQYEVIRSIAVLNKEKAIVKSEEKFILYQGTVNHGRSFETLIPAFKWIDMPLWICGDGNFYNEAVELVKQNNLQHKVLFKGKFIPADLKKITPKATLGITLFENTGLSNYYSLANRFFDYMHAGVPQLCVAYPAYRQINKQFKVAVLIDDLSSAFIAATINEVINNEKLLEEMKTACLAAREVYNWQTEEKKLITFYKSLLD